MEVKGIGRLHSGLTLRLPNHLGMPKPCFLSNEVSTQTRFISPGQNTAQLNSTPAPLSQVNQGSSACLTLRTQWLRP